MKIKKLILIALSIVVFPCVLYAAKGFVPLTNQTVTSIAGVDDTDEIIPMRVDSNGSVITISGGTIAAFPPSSVIVDIPNAGATDRTQGPSNSDISACTIQSKSTNTGSIYIGGDDVTNASGTNQGFEVVPGSALSDITISNTNLLYFATDNAGDDAILFCN